MILTQELREISDIMEFDDGGPFTVKRRTAYGLCEVKRWTATYKDSTFHVEVIDGNKFRYLRDGQVTEQLGPHTLMKIRYRIELLPNQQ